MSACWLDAANSGNQDIYVSNMWSAAGQRIANSPRSIPTIHPTPNRSTAPRAR